MRSHGNAPLKDWLTVLTLLKPRSSEIIQRSVSERDTHHISEHKRWGVLRGRKSGHKATSVKKRGNMVREKGYSPPRTEV